MDPIDPKTLKVADLKAELTKRNLDVSGVKAVLVQRLQEALDEEEFGDGGMMDAPIKSPEPTPVSSPAPVVAAAAAPVATAVVAPATSPVVAAAASVAEHVAVEAVPVAEAEAAPLSAAEQASKDALAAAKAKRAERFGIPIKEAPVPKPVQVKAPKAEKETQQQQGKGKNGGNKGNNQTKPVAAAKPAAAPVDPAVAEKLKKRAERFGISEKAAVQAAAAPTAGSAMSEEEASKKRAREMRFKMGLSGNTEEVSKEEEAKKKQRMDRFGAK